EEEKEEDIDTLPANHIERKLMELWTGVLLIPEIGSADNFFALGGNSLNIMNLNSKVHREFGVKIPIEDIFNNPTIRLQAKLIIAAQPEKYTSVELAEDMEYYPLSSAQKRLYILYQMDMKNTVYNISQLISLGNEWDGERLEETFKQLINRHESLRTSFHMKDREPMQRIHEAVDFTIHYDETGNLEQFAKPFDLSVAPLLRVAVVKTSEDNYILLVIMHHTISDGVSFEVLISDFTTFHGGGTLPPLRLRYRDFSQWQSFRKETGALKQQEDYWLKEFADNIPVLDLPLDYPRPPVRNFEGRRTAFEIPAHDTQALKSIASAEGASLYMTLLALINILLSKLSRQQDIVIGTPIAGRGHADLEHIIGMFVNTLALRNYPVGGKSFTLFLNQIKDRTFEAFENQDHQFEDLVEQVSVNRDTARNPLFDVLYTLRIFDYDTGNKFSHDIPGQPQTKSLHRESRAFRSTSKFDLTWSAVEAGDKLRIMIEYCTKLFREDTIQRFIHFFETIVSAVVADPRIPLGQIEIISEQEKHRVLMDFNDTEAEYPGDKTIHRLFEEQVERTPHHIALEMESRCLTYDALNNQSNRLAGFLRQNGVTRGSIAGIMMARSVETIIGIFGILKAGGAFLFIDPDYPQERIDYMLRDSGAGVLIHGGIAHFNPPPPSSLRVPLSRGEFADVLLINLTGMNEGDHSALGTGNASNAGGFYSPLERGTRRRRGGCVETGETVSHKADQLCYIIYTSGSTGVPKGVLGLHKATVNRFNWMWTTFPFKSNDVCCQKTSMNFVDCIWETFGPLLKGVPLVIIPGDVVTDPPAFVHILKTRQVTRIVLVPGLLYRFFDGNTRYYKELPRLTLWVSSGESLQPRFPTVFRESVPQSTLLNLYGSSEISADVTWYNTSGERENQDGLSSVPIGRPIDNTQIYILNGALSPVPIGIAGEIYAGGDGLAAGYLNQPELTAQRFVPDPFNENQPASMFRTGDLGRYLADGVIEYLGRKGRQVKIRGFRIEPGEIESRLLRHDHIKEVVVEPGKDHSGQDFLCAYYIPVEGEYISDQNLEPDSLKEYLSRTLPNYMIPSFIVPMDRMPLTPTGKIDRNALPAPTIRETGTRTAPRNEIEERLTVIWSSVLGIDQEIIGIDANFFELGGHSLKAMILSNWLHERFDVEIPMTELFNTPTIRGLSRYIQETETSRYVAIEPIEERQYYSLSSAQKRLYVLYQMDMQSTAYNIAQRIPLADGWDGRRMEETFQQLIHRHESLRTSFHMREEKPIQRIHDAVDFTIHYNETGDWERLVFPFDLSVAPLLRAAVVKKQGQKDFLVVDMHHIVSDGMSIDVLASDFAILYDGGSLPPLRLRYIDFSQWQARQKQTETLKNQETYWLKEFSGEIPLLDLPLDHPRPPVQSFEGSRIDFQISVAETRSLKAIALKEGASLYMALLAVLNILLAKLCNREDIVIGSPIAGRRHADLEPIIGMFVNTLVLRNYPARHKSFIFFLNQLKDRTLDAFENQEYPFEDLVERVAVNRALDRNPIVDVTFTLRTFNTPGSSGNPRREGQLPGRTSKFDLTWSAMEKGDSLSFTLEYCVKLFNLQTIRRFIRYFKQTLSSVVTDPRIALGRIRIISEQERKRVLYRFNDTGTGFPVNKPIHLLFREQTERTPDHVALVGPNLQAANNPLVSITYNELDEQSDRLAALLTGCGVQPESIVAIMMERSLEMMVGIFGILKSGGAYLPVDPDYPRERIDYMLKDSGAGLLIYNDLPHFSVESAPHPSGAPLSRGEFADVRLINLTGMNGSNPSDLVTGNASNASNAGSFYSPLERGTRRGRGGGVATGETAPYKANRLCYIIYTSGSTGRPKGNLTTHQNVIPVVRGNNYIHLTPVDRILQLSNYAFDGSVFDIY
ncbi:MAG: AMP-binding protein, partial [bacterium]|nr:AMP-binding protein [bacterium]